MFVINCPVMYLLTDSMSLFFVIFVVVIYASMIKINDNQTITKHIHVVISQINNNNITNTYYQVYTSCMIYAGICVFV